MTLTQTRAWRRSGVVSTLVIVANPMRGSATSRVTIAADLLPEQLVDPVGALGHRPLPTVADGAAVSWERRRATDASAW